MEKSTENYQPNNSVLEDFYISKDAYFPECYYVSLKKVDSFYEKVYGKYVKNSLKYRNLFNKARKPEIVQVEFKDLAQLLSTEYANFITGTLLGNPNPLNRKK